MASSAKMYLELQKMTNQANKEEMAFNKQEAETSRNWQKMMSDTAHAREVADLKKAGLNPVLSANTGAQSYTTSSASADVDSAAGAVSNAYGADVSAAATRHAAAVSAQAMRDSAALSAQAQKYASDKQYQINKDNIDYKKWETMNKPQSDTTAIDKYISKIIHNTSERRAYSSNIISNSSILKRAQNSGASVSFNSLSKGTQNRIDSALKHWNISRTSYNRSNYIRYLVTGNIFYVYKFK